MMFSVKRPAAGLPSFKRTSSRAALLDRACLTSSLRLS